jgi:protein-tyrosine phosphatase
MIDWHCHLLPGVDDGSNSLDESLAMGRLLAEAGFTEVYCTPHCLHGAYDNTPKGVQQATAALQKAFQQHNIPLKLHPGMEYYLDEMLLRNMDELQPLGTSRLILVEAAQQAHPDMLKDALFQFLRRKWIPVVAHPERCVLFDQPCSDTETSVASWLARLWPFRRTGSVDVLPPATTLLQTLIDMGCQFQGNIPSFAGCYGPEVADQAHAHLAAGLYGYFGSDGHDARSLKRNLARGLRMVTEAQTLSVNSEC